VVSVGVKLAVIRDEPLPATVTVVPEIVMAEVSLDA
jgi:hypothetical protein